MLLLAVYSASQWSLMREMAKRLMANGRSVGVLWTGSANATSAQQVQAQAKTLGATFLLRDEFNAPAVASLRKRSWLERMPWSKPASDILPEDHPYRELVRRQIGGAQKLLGQFRIEALLVCEDGPGGDNALIAVARTHRVPVLIVPFGIGESRDYDVFLEDKHREGNLNLVPQGPLGTFLQQQGTHWIRRTPYGDALLFPAEFVAARILEGLDLPLPWVVHGGLANCIAVESPAMRRHYQREGLQVSKLQDTGSMYCDTVFEALQGAPAANRAHAACSRINASRTSVLISLPPSYHVQRGAMCEHETYEAMCTAVMALFKALPQVDCTLSIHPNSGEAARRALLACGAAVSEEWLVALIPRHDIFLTTFSSTIRWAITAHKPVLNYDMYGFGLETYTNAPGVRTFRQLAPLAAELHKLCADADAYHQASAQQRALAADWGQLDGKNFQRVLALIDRMCSR